MASSESPKRLIVPAMSVIMKLRCRSSGLYCERFDIHQTRPFIIMIRIVANDSMHVNSNFDKYQIKYALPHEQSVKQRIAGY